MNELTQLLAIAVVLAPITTGFVQLYKKQGVSGKLLPALAILTGIILALVWALAFSHTDLALQYGLAGVLSGLSSVGVYELAKGAK